MIRNMKRLTSDDFSCVCVVCLSLLLCIFAASRSAVGAPKDKDEDFTRIYNHTYDEAFQAAQEAIERMGLFVTDKDKDKGVLRGRGQYIRRGTAVRAQVEFEIHIESVSPKPETRVTIACNAAKTPGYWGAGRSVRKELPADMLAEIQKVLATYK